MSRTSTREGAATATDAEEVEASGAEEVAASDAEEAETSDADDTESSETDAAEPTSTDRAGGIRWSRVFAYGVLPALALLLALGAGFAKWFGATQQIDPEASAQAVEAGTNGAIAMLSYQHDTANEELVAASERLTGEFKDAYTLLVTDVVIPGAQEQQISAVASVPAAAPVSVTDNEAVVVVFVNQTTTVGTNPPTDLASTVRVTLDKVDDRWLISKFEPI